MDVKKKKKKLSANGDPDFLKTVITGDETQVYGYNPETTAQSSQWLSSTSPRLKKTRQMRSKVKVMLTVFFFTATELCITNTYQKAKLLTNIITNKFSVIFLMQFSARDWICGSHASGNCITTTPPPILHVWPRISCPSTEFPTFVRLLATSGWSPSLRCLWKGLDLRAERTSCRTQQHSW